MLKKFDIVFLILLVLISALSFNTFCFADGSLYKTPTYFNISERIVCENDDYSNIYEYITENIDFRFNITDYYVDKSEIKNGVIYLNYLFDGKQTGIKYKITLINGDVVDTISRFGKVNYNAESIYCYSTDTGEKTVPYLDGLKAFKRTQIFDIDDGFIKDENGKRIEHVDFYVNKNGNAMAPVRQLSEYFGNSEFTIKWLDDTGCIVIGETDKRFNRYEPYRSVFSIDTVNNKITGEINRESFDIQLNENDIENKNGSFYISLNKLLNAFGIDDDRIIWYKTVNAFEVDSTPNFDTDKVTICSLYSKNNDNPYFADITDENEINMLKELCTSDSFRSGEKNMPRYQGEPDCYIDFNNGTIVKFYYNGDKICKFNNCQIMPDGVMEYAQYLLENEKGEYRNAGEYF